ncbi:MAG: ribosomal protein modification protein RimK [Bacteroidetes bacterium]|nr:ribosomal protein modification protein RimK [Bacteroidota bacterium]
MMQSAKAKQTIGRRELIDFPELGLFNITAKVDTGAYTTALHCHDIREENGILYFKLLDPSHPDYTEKEQQFSSYFQKEIKNSFGEMEKRYIIKTVIKIGRRRINSLISLTDRGTMRYPVLIGRKLLKKRFVVDVSLLNNIPPPIKKKKSKP